MSRQLVMPILKNNGSLFEKIKKLNEEQWELHDAYYKHQEKQTLENGERLASEAYDCLQVALGILLEVDSNTIVDLVKQNDKHIAKLVNRHLWEIRQELIKIQIP